MDGTPTPREAFEVLLHSHLPILWRVIRRLVRESADAEDLLQEACLKAFRRRYQFQPGTDVKAWLLTILLNTYRDWVRTMLRQPALLELDTLPAQAQRTSSSVTAARVLTPEHRMQHAELGQLVRVALDDLPPEFRLVVILADVEGYSYQEIATIMTCPIGTVMSRLSRARHLLRTTLQSVLEE